MKNEFEISNLNEIYKGDFDQMVAMQGLETFSKAAVDAFYNQFGDILQKSEENELSSEDKNQMELIKAEVNSLKMWEVLDDKFNKSVVFTRPSQIDIEKGIYKDTALNRKMGRVGQKWGGKKEEEGGRKTNEEEENKESGAGRLRIEETINNVPIYVERDIPFGNVKNTPYKKFEGSLNDFMNLKTPGFYYNGDDHKKTIYISKDAHGRVLHHIG